MIFLPYRKKKNMAEKKKYGDIEFNDQQMEEFR